MNSSRNSILIAAPKENIYTALRTALSGFSQRTIYAATMTQAKQRLMQGDVRLLIAYLPMPDDTGLETCIDLARKTGISVLLLVKAESMEQVSYRVRSSGIMVLPRPLRTDMLVQTLGLLEAMESRLESLREENERLRRRMDELGMVSRAKLLLIQYRKCTEEEAHHLLEKMAMDNAITKKAAAMRIIDEFSAEAGN